MRADEIIVAVFASLVAFLSFFLRPTIASSTVMTSAVFTPNTAEESYLSNFSHYRTYSWLTRMRSLS